MKLFSTFCWAICLAGLISAAPTAPSLAQSADSVTLSVAQARSLALNLIRQKKPQAAREIALGILRGDPDDIRALLILAQAEARLGQPAKARFAARRAFRKSDKPNEKYTAAALVADSFAQQDKLNQTQIWLRRAEFYATEPRQKQALARSYAKVRNANPIRLQFSFNVKPTDNLNNAPTDGTIIIGGLPFELSGSGRALSGTELSYGLDASYSKPTDAGNRWSLALSLNARDYLLSSEAKRQAPDAKASDFAFREVKLSGRYTWLSQDKGSTSAGLSLGANWYGGDRLTNSISLDLARRWFLDDRTVLDGRLSYAIRERQDSEIRSSDVTQLTLGWTRVLENRDRLRLSATLIDTASDSAFVAYDGATLSGSYALADPIFGATTRLNLSVGTRSYDRAVSLYGPDPRADTQYSGGVSLFFKDASVFGFAPTVSLSISQTQSNLDLYDSEQIGLSFGIGSVF
ncbi:surface lipoprotein assembly modifier [Nereida sp. MMG025]|uniref:surface lipoprotein assembly modifier n=1 Tax=Nereida sp. MMG025 TaxID=2909981 RepID=UPI001F466FB9|nr:surface lipoprotein assembly modifier [Nereida sp. MMG025]MCF6443882.1 surface lipoprotein assembly modifier [Nereida sp. MMG025]